MNISKKIMILTINFPPFDGGRIGSSIRTFTMADFLARKGFSVDVVVPKRYAKDREAPLMNEKIKVFKYFSPFHYYDHVKNKLPLFHLLFKVIISLVKKALKFFFLNPFDFYSYCVAVFCCRHINKHNIGVVISSIPHISIISIVNKMQKILGRNVLWISDVRDLSYLHPALRYKKKENRKWQKKNETNYILKSDICFFVSSGMIDTVRKIFNENNLYFNEEKYILMENGYTLVDKIKPQKEIEDFVKEAKSFNKLVLIYAGTGELLENVDGYRKNKTLNCIVDTLSNDEELNRRFALIIQGEVKNTQEYFSKISGELMVLVLPPVSNEQIRANMKLADIGININVDTEYSPLMIGGKIYDYCVSGLALLLIFPDNAYSLKDFAGKHNNKPYFADIFDNASITKILKKIAENPGEMNNRRFTESEMEPHSREKQYSKMLEILSKT